MSTTKYLTRDFRVLTMAVAFVVMMQFARAESVKADPAETESSAAEYVGNVQSATKQVIGPTAVVGESESDFAFPARVDTGATTSSIHVEDCTVEDEAGEMAENLGKTIRFRIKNPQGKSEWLERKIAEISTIKTSEREETRYKVPITLHYKDVKKKVLVSLNDRSHMNYPLLLGRNFLQGDFVVDVDLGNQGRITSKSEPASPVTAKSDTAKSDTAKSDPGDSATGDSATGDSAAGNSETESEKQADRSNKMSDPDAKSDDAKSDSDAKSELRSPKE